VIGLLKITRKKSPLCRTLGDGARSEARSLTAAQFQAVLKELHEPFATVALLCVRLGLRISEALALRWSDVFPQA